MILKKKFYLFHLIKLCVHGLTQLSKDCDLLKNSSIFGIAPFLPNYNIFKLMNKYQIPDISIDFGDLKITAAVIISELHNRIPKKKDISQYTPKDFK